MAHALEVTRPAPEAVLTKAALRAARRLKLTNRELAAVLGVGQATISRAGAGRPLPAEGKTLELAALFVRLYRSLDAIAGGDDATAAAWLRTENTALGRPPAEAIATVCGLTDTLAYLDARRAVA
jgi:transcriptional regulator with XRE-family HTH domain